MSESDRGIVTVIDQLLLVIPSEETELCNRLIEYKETLWNQAPKALKCAYNWTPVQKILANNIRSIDTEWQKSVVKIFTNEE